jgi:transcriptional regulator with XRE-family HTH domain
MNPVNERIKQVRKTLNITQRNFCKQISVSQSSLGEIETGVRNVNDRIMQLICSQFNVNKNWIKTGNGEMFDNKKPDIKLENLIRIYEQLGEPLQDYLLKQSELILDLHNDNLITKK